MTRNPWTERFGRGGCERRDDGQFDWRGVPVNANLLGEFVILATTIFGGSNVII